MFCTLRTGHQYDSLYDTYDASITLKLNCINDVIDDILCILYLQQQQE